jgi:hypothetical protein
MHFHLWVHIALISVTAIIRVKTGLYFRNSLLLPPIHFHSGSLLNSQVFLPTVLLFLVSTTDSTLTSFTSVLGTLVEGVNYPTTPFVYQQYSFPLAAFAGTDIYVAIKNKNTFGDGLLIDRVDIGTKPALNATPMSIDMNKFIPTSSPLTPPPPFKMMETLYNHSRSS